MHRFHTFCCQAVQSITRPGTICPIIIQIHAKHHDGGGRKKEEREIKRHVGQGNPARVSLQREREGERGTERQREAETQGAGPTRCSSSQLHSREVTMASDKQSTIDHPSPRWRDAAHPSAVLPGYIATPSFCNWSTIKATAHLHICSP